jgi:hypothetical protein
VAINEKKEVMPIEAPSSSQDDSRKFLAIETLVNMGNYHALGSNAHSYTLPSQKINLSSYLVSTTFSTASGPLPQTPLRPP